MSWLMGMVVCFVCLTLLTVQILAKTRTTHCSCEEVCRVGCKVYKVNETWVGEVGDCKVYTCYGNNNIGALGCPLLRAGPGYYIADGDENKKYPDCCPKPIKA